MRLNCENYLGVPFNQPIFCSSATWSPNAVTFANSSTINSPPYGLFITTNNTVYVVDTFSGRIQVWLEGSTNVTSTITTVGGFSTFVFVNMEDDVYYHDWISGGSVGVWSTQTSSLKPLLYIGAGCFSLFIDTNNSLYCSSSDTHRVIRRSLNSTDNQLMIVAGTGCAGFLPNMLNAPHGIFVSIMIDLYVADFGNNRVQIFRTGDLSGITVAGREAPGTITLNGPIAVILDGKGYLFISDANSARIIGSGPDGFRTISGAYGWGTAANQLRWPQGIAFDSRGNLFVADNNNNRIQKFLLSTNSCSKWNLYTCESPCTLTYKVRPRQQAPCCQLTPS